MAGLFDESYDESEEQEQAGGAFVSSEAIASLVDGNEEVVGEILEDLTDPENQLLLEYGTEQVVVNRENFEGKTVAQLFQEYAPFLGIAFDPARINYRTGGEFVAPETPTQAGRAYTSSMSHDGKGLPRKALRVLVA